MTDHATDLDRLFDLVGMVCDDGALSNDFVELDSIVRSDEAARDWYLRYCRAHSALKLELRAHRVTQVVCQQIGFAPNATVSSNLDVLTVTFPAPTFVSTIFHAPFTYLSSGWPVAYLIATVIFGIGAIIGSFIYVSQPGDIAQESPVVVAKDHVRIPLQKGCVGKITGKVDCEWSDPKSASVTRVVCLGQTFVLASGLLELTYDTGAKVILQGPATYEVNSKNGGYLLLGKLTGKVEITKAKGFIVHTPTATVTDLGTEFGVCVDESGATNTDVFRGAVEVRATSAKNGTENVIRLTETQSARVQINEQHIAAISRSKANPEAFVRRMPQPPRRMAVKTYNTGEGVKEGDPDPHWQIVAASNDPNFQSRAAVVTSIHVDCWLDNEVGRSKWVSIESRPDVSNGATYTFRTSFDLADAVPESVLLKGWFAVDNHVQAIRLNGNKVSVPEHEYDDAFGRYYGFVVRSGFVEGTNIVEIDVENGTPEASDPLSLMGLRVDLEATALYKQHEQPEKEP